MNMGQVMQVWLSCFATWFYYHLIAKTAPHPWPNPHIFLTVIITSNSYFLTRPPLPHDYLYYQSYWIPFIPSLQLHYASSSIKMASGM